MIWHCISSGIQSICLSNAAKAIIVIYQPQNWHKRGDPFTVSILNNKLQINYKLHIRFCGWVYWTQQPISSENCNDCHRLIVSRITKLHLSVHFIDPFTFRPEAAHLNPCQTICLLLGFLQVICSRQYRNLTTAAHRMHASRC